MGDNYLRERETRARDNIVGRGVRRRVFAGEGFGALVGGLAAWIIPE
jgi:hypothetical protein